MVKTDNLSCRLGAFKPNSMIPLRFLPERLFCFDREWSKTDIRNEPDFNALARDSYHVGISEFLRDVNR